MELDLNQYNGTLMPLHKSFTNGINDFAQAAF